MTETNEGNEVIKQMTVEEIQAEFEIDEEQEIWEGIFRHVADVLRTKNDGLGWELWDDTVIEESPEDDSNYTMRIEAFNIDVLNNPGGLLINLYESESHSYQYLAFASWDDEDGVEISIPERDCEVLGSGREFSLRHVMRLAGELIDRLEDEEVLEDNTGVLVNGEIIPFVFDPPTDKKINN